jgi:neural cell adhesion molecule
MDHPCVFHLIPAGKPDPVHNCTVRNQTYSTLYVTCGTGFDGGLPQVNDRVIFISNSMFFITHF